MSTDVAPAAPAPRVVAVPRVLGGRAARVLLLLAVLVCAAGVVAGIFSGALWLDETISVEIARRPLPGLLSALRHDGSPPLYYVLLHAWMAVFGTGTWAVRMFSVVLVPVAGWLLWILGRRLRGPDGALAAVVVFCALPWTMRYGSETRMYLLVVVLALVGALALIEVRRAPSWRAVVALGVCAAALLWTHYWSVFLLAVVALWHAPRVLRREPPALRVAAGMALGGVLFLPQVPTFLYQSAHTAAPWARPPGVADLLKTPLLWSAGPFAGQLALGLLVATLVVVGALRVPAARPFAAVGTATLVVAWTVTHFGGGAYLGRYTAVAVPLVSLAVGLGATALPGRWAPGALAALLVVGAITGLPSAAGARGPAQKVATAFLSRAQPGDVLVFCPDQLGPPVHRLLGPGYVQVVYPTLGDADIVDWVDYATRNRTADPGAVADRINALAAGRSLFLEKASAYRTFHHGDTDDCNQLLRELSQRRGAPVRLYGSSHGSGEQLYRFAS